jgi:hypothetical protein
MDGHGTVAVLTPLCEGAPIELGNGYWRKQVIRHGDFKYKDPRTGEVRTLNFTPDYTAKLAQAYREKAYDAVPLQFAGPDNKHTNAIEATRGQVVGLEATADGLDAIVSLEPDAEKVIDRHKALPVSVRIIENLDRIDGKKWPAAVQHVLATWDPQLTAMKPWERVELANDDVDHVLDLTQLAAPSGVDYQEGATVPETKTDDTKMVENLSPEALTRLAKLAELLNDEGMFLEDDEDEDGYIEPTDAEKDKIAAEALAGDQKPDGKAPVDQQVVAASNEHTPSATEIELATRLDRAEQETARLRDEAAARRYTELRNDLVTTAGIPPAAIDMCKEWLTGDTSIELSNGVTKDPGADIVKMLREIGKVHQLVDLSEPTVFATERSTPSEDDAFAANAEWAKAFLAERGMR